MASLAELVERGYTTLTRPFWDESDYVKINGDQAEYCLIDGLVEIISTDELIDTGWIPKQ